jgi:hypothetical protein
VLIKKMGSLQKAVKALLAVFDDRMLDGWITNEHWVRQIRENSENDNSIRSLNSALAKVCVWQDNHAILQGQMVFYNKKKIRIWKTKGTATNKIRFYYILSAGKPAPTIPSEEGILSIALGWPSQEQPLPQADRSATQSQIASAPQTKTAESFSVATAKESPLSASKRPLPQPPPK